MSSVTRSVACRRKHEPLEPVGPREQELPAAVGRGRVADDPSVELRLDGAGQEPRPERGDRLVRRHLRAARPEDEPGGEGVRVQDGRAGAVDATGEDEVVLAERRVGDRPEDVDAAGRGGGVEGEGGGTQSARVEDAAPPGGALAAPEDRVRAALRERLDDADGAVGPEHGHGRGREDARGEAVPRHARRPQAAVGAEPGQVEGRLVVGLLDRVRDRRPARGVQGQPRDAQQRPLGGVGDLDHPPAVAAADDEPDPASPPLDEHGVLRQARDAAFEARQRGDRRRAPGGGAGREHEPASVHPRDPRTAVARDRERPLGHTPVRRAPLGPSPAGAARTPARGRGPSRRNGSGRVPT